MPGDLLELLMLGLDIPERELGEDAIEGEEEDMEGEGDLEEPRVSSLVGVFGLQV